MNGGASWHFAHKIVNYILEIVDMIFPEIDAQTQTTERQSSDKAFGAFREMGGGLLQIN